MRKMIKVADYGAEIRVIVSAIATKVLASQPNFAKILEAHRQASGCDTVSGHTISSQKLRAEVFTVESLFQACLMHLFLPTTTIAITEKTPRKLSRLHGGARGLKSTCA